MELKKKKKKGFASPYNCNGDGTARKEKLQQPGAQKL